jgi:hypothetical protein
MTTYQNAPNELAVISALQAWIMMSLNLPIAQVVEAHENLVAPPLDPFVVMSHITRNPVSTPWLTNQDTGDINTESVIINLGIEYEYQVDIYGDSTSNGPADSAMLLHVLFRADPTSEWFQAYGLTNGFTIDTLDADPPKHTAITNSENQYEERWTVRLRFNVIEAISVPASFMSSASIKPPINVSTLPR